MVNDEVRKNFVANFVANFVEGVGKVRKGLDKINRMQWLEEVVSSEWQDLKLCRSPAFQFVIHNS